jgi:hypothetical protein
LRYDQVQIIGTHNSYKLEVDQGVDHAMRAFTYTAEGFTADELAYKHAYHHPPLDVQLDIGVRALEIDVYDDPAGGRFASPGGYAAMKALGLSPNAPFDPHGEMDAPGFKVLHVPDWDFLSNCPTLSLCLETLRDWSEQHPRHFPIMIRIDVKESAPGPIGDLYSPAAVSAFDDDSFRRLETAIVRSMGTERLYFRTDYSDAWPKVAALRGRFIFVMSGRTDVGKRYQKAMSGASRLFFTFFENDGTKPLRTLGDSPEEAAARSDEAGSVIYTRSETITTKEARENDTSRRDQAFSSAGTLIWTDYAIADARFSSYRVRFPDNSFVRPHPQTAQPSCSALAPAVERH